MWLICSKSYTFAVPPNKLFATNRKIRKGLSRCAVSDSSSTWFRLVGRRAVCSPGLVWPGDFLLDFEFELVAKVFVQQASNKNKLEGNP